MAKWALKVGQWRGVPIRVHASTLLGLYFFSGFRFEPVWWLCSLGLVLLHELGHALVVRLAGGRPTEVMLTGFLRVGGRRLSLGRAAIACGGVSAQFVLLFVALALDGFGLVPNDRAANIVLSAATVSNVWLIALNLLPISPLDGAEAWAFPFQLGQLTRSRLTHRGHRMSAKGQGAEERAKNLAAQLLENARKEEDPP